jgi:uncharacterized cupredoxin-like copper-binding protein
MPTMKMRAISGLFALAFLVAGCGGNGHDHGAMTGGGAVAASVGEPGDPAEADRTVEVEATESLKFDPASLEVGAGETITFVVTNDTSTPHEFVLGDEAYQDSHGDAMANGGMQHEGNAVTLDPGVTQELTWTFTDAGEVIYACHVAGHYASGMKGTISVE